MKIRIDDFKMNCLLHQVRDNDKISTYNFKEIVSTLFFKMFHTALELVHTLWSWKEDYGIPVAKVNGRNVSDTDIRSLQHGEWLTDLV